VSDEFWTTVWDLTPDQLASQMSRWSTNDRDSYQAALDAKQALASQQAAFWTKWLAFGTGALAIATVVLAFVTVFK
jgi:hypothetical protein